MWTVRLVRAISSQVETDTLVYDAVNEAKRRYYIMYQVEEDTNVTSLKDYISNVDTMDYYKSSIFEDPGLTAHEMTRDSQSLMLPPRLL